MSNEFKEYIKNVVINTKACADKLEELGANVSGTDNHLFNLNVLDTYGMTGKDAQIALEGIGITTNKNMIPNDTLPPSKASGLRIGFAAVTTRGCNKAQAEQIAFIIHNYLNKSLDKEKAQSMVKELTSSWKQIQEI